MNIGEESKIAEGPSIREAGDKAPGGLQVHLHNIPIHSLDPGVYSFPCYGLGSEIPGNEACVVCTLSQGETHTGQAASKITFWLLLHINKNKEFVEAPWKAWKKLSALDLEAALQ